MDKHPFQGHIVAVGSYDGMLTVYDMRKAQTPVTVLAGPESCLNEVRFHPDRADHLFTASESGAVWHWAALSAKTPVSSKRNFSVSILVVYFKKGLADGTSTNLWLTGDLAAQQLDIKEVLPSLPLAVNSVDVCGEALICGGDNEAFYYVPTLVF